ncbi:hypothetical protein GBA52_013718 [Prunus armeniaca]|nr:hypothetical protein GBA52_013718 [Prunus armeniaca]
MNMICGSYYFPKKNKGDDAHFICAQEQTIGVADGVGGWAKLGVDASQYARELMRNSIKSVKKQQAFGGVDPRRVLNEAAAQKAGIKYLGGKKDDITVVVGYIMATSTPAPSCVEGLEIISDNTTQLGLKRSTPWQESLTRNGFRICFDHNLPANWHCEDEKTKIPLKQKETKSDTRNEPTRIGIPIRNSTSMRMICGSYYWPKEDKLKPEGDDAHFICAQEQTIGVADGVGGWAKHGVDAGQYARELMCNSIMSVQKQTIVDPRRVLNEAYADTKSLDEDSFSPYSKAAQEAGKNHPGGKKDDITVVVGHIMVTSPVCSCVEDFVDRPLEIIWDNTKPVERATSTPW